MIATANPPLPSVVSRNGVLIPPQQATVSVLGNTLYGAFGVYESIQLWNGVVFYLDAHLERLQASAAQIGLPLCADLGTYRRWIEELLEVESITQATIRLFAIGPDGDRRPHSFIWLEPARVLSAEMVRDGVGAVTYVGERALPNAKSLNTLVNTIARRRAQAVGEHEGLLVDRQGCVTEGASSNLCVVQEGTLMAPPAEDILEGVTLGLVLRMANEANVPIVRRRLPLAEQPLWDEAFLTSTSRHVLPLVRIDGNPIGPGAPGPITGELQRRFENDFAAVTGMPYRQ